MTLDPSLDRKMTGGHLTVAATGSWTAARAGALERLVEAEVRRASDTASMTLDVAGITELDTYGAWLLERLARKWSDRGQHGSLDGIADRYRRLFDWLHRAGRREPAKPARRTRVHAALERIGRAGGVLGRDLLTLLAMFGALAEALWCAATRPRRFRLTSAVNQLDRVGLQAVPIILLITFLIGAILRSKASFISASLAPTTT